MTRYASCGEVTLAWRSHGDSGLDLLVVPPIASHVEAMSQLPGYRDLIDRLSRFARVITFDHRGGGMSAAVAAGTLSDRIEDMVSILDAADVQRAALLGISDGTFAAIGFAARFPERTRALALFGAAVASPPLPEWGTGATLSTMVGPKLRIDVARRVEQACATPSVVRDRIAASQDIDLRQEVSFVSVPTVVFHRAEDPLVPRAEAKWIADRIEGARLIDLPGDTHLPFPDDVATIADTVATLAETQRVTTSPPIEMAAADFDPDAIDALLGGALADGPFDLGKFIVKRLLGKGGMGVVFLAERPATRDRVALKIMRHADRDTNRRFRREAVAIASIAHPNVVAILELGLEATVPYLVMEYVAGGTANDIKGVVSWRRAAELTACAARGLGAGHARGLVHRDVKPENLFLTDRHGDELKVGDFGIVKLVGAATLTREGAMLGTIGYMAPEQITGGDVDARSDVWALGATCYRLLTGRRAFEGTTAEIMANTLMDPVGDPREHVPGIPDAIADLVARMTAHEPAERPADGTAVAAELAALLARS